jgi:hypothetical protein
MQERRSKPENTKISTDLLDKGKAQLEKEIKLIETWLTELDQTSKDNPEALAARKSYGDMLQSRQDLLLSLEQHKKSF